MTNNEWYVMFNNAIPFEHDKSIYLFIENTKLLFRFN